MTDTEQLDIGSALETRAVGWLAERSRYLDPALASDDTTLFARKALVEVAVMVGLRARLDPAPLEPDYEVLLDLVAEVSSRPSYRELVRRDRRALLLYAGSYAALRLCGREDLEFRHVLEQTVQGRYAASFERTPYRHLDLLHTLELAGIACPAPDVDEILQFTLMTADPNVWELSVADVYAITHAIFYATDFGLRSAPWPVGTDEETVADLVRGCLAVARAREDADLVGELLMCLTCLRVPVTDEESAARAWLRSWQEVDGRLEGPPGVIPERLGRADPTWGDWATAYHTTIVGALENLLFRCTPRPTEGVAASPRVELPRRGLAEAAAWLDEHSWPDLRVTAWAGQAWENAGHPERARAMLTRLAADPTLPEQVAGAAGDVALHAAVLAHRHDVDIPVLSRFLEDAGAALAACERSDTRLDTARAHLAAVDGREVPPRLPSVIHWPPTDLPLRERSLMLAADLARRGPNPLLGAGDAATAAEVLVLAVRTAVEDYDLGWLSVALRGLVRLPQVPGRLVRDAVAFLASQQDRSGAIGAPLCDDVHERLALHRQSTLLAVSALVESCAPSRHQGHSAGT